MSNASHPSEQGDPRDSSHYSVFRTTRWEIIRLAQGAETERFEGMERLARTYWYPLYAFARRKGSREADAQDLTQGFLSRFVNSNSLESVSPEKGRFRSFLLVCFKNYLADERAKTTARKRGGGIEFVPLDASGAEERLKSESSFLSIEESYDLDWAQSLMSSVIDRMRNEARRLKREQRFEHLLPFMIEDPTSHEQKNLAASLDLGESGVRSAIQRFRARFAEYLWTEIACTVENTDQIKDEMRHVLGLLASVAPDH